MDNYLKLEITTEDLKNLDTLLERLKKQNPGLDIQVDSIEDDDQPEC